MSTYHITVNWMCNLDNSLVINMMRTYSGPYQSVYYGAFLYRVGGAQWVGHQGGVHKTVT